VRAGLPSQRSLPIVLHTAPPPPASAFYEWTLNETDGKKDPWHIRLPGDAPFSFAGIWAHNDSVISDGRFEVQSVQDFVQMLIDQTGFVQALMESRAAEDLTKPEV